MRRQNGFTLIELMVVVAIIGIIAGIAYPSYLKSMQKGRRVDGKQVLTQVAQALERCYSSYGLYNSANCPEYTALTGGNITTPQGYYTISYTAAKTGGTSYEVTATAKSTGPQASDTNCYVLKLDNTGAQTSSTSGGTATSGCW